MTVTFEQANSEVFAEMLPMLKRHAHEAIGVDYDIDPDFERYQELINSGHYVLFVVKDAQTIIGYAGFFVSESLHRKGFKLANCDMIYMEPAYRGNGHLLIEACNNEFQAAGFDEIFHTVTHRYDYTSTLTRLGFTEFERVYCKALK